MDKTTIKSAVEQRRQPIGTLGSNLGGAYFTVGAKETWPKFQESKIAIEQNGNNDLIINRSPRRFAISDHLILEQKVEVNDIDGTVSVVFNPNTKDEARAAVVAGGTGYGIATGDAVNKALRGEDCIFVDATGLCKKANELNKNELTRVEALIKALESQRDAIKSTIAANKEKADLYVRTIVDSTPKTIEGTGDSVTIVVEKADEE